MKTEVWLMENQGSLRGLKIFEKFRVEYDAEIKKLIDQMIKDSTTSDILWKTWEGWNMALIELKERLEKK